jgi:hypothetical protein
MKGWKKAISPHVTYALSGYGSSIANTDGYVPFISGIFIAHAHGYVPVVVIAISFCIHDLLPDL